MKTVYIAGGLIVLFLIIRVFMFSGPTNVPSTNSTSTNTTNTNSNTSMDSQITALKVEDEMVGTGATAVAGDSITMNYVGMLTNGTVFDASKNHGTTGFTFTLGVGQVIQGWDQGIVGMKVGGKRKLTIPSSLAYGSQAVGGVIPANSALIFEVELLKIAGK